MGSGTHSLSFTKESPKGNQVDQKKKMQNLQEGRRGSQLRGLECPVWAPIPRPCSAPLAFRAGRKNTDEKKALAAWEGKQMVAGESVQPDTGGRPLLRGQENGYCYTSISPKTPASPGQSLLTCMIGYRSSTPARVPVLGIILQQEEKTVYGATQKEDKRE